MQIVKSNERSFTHNLQDIIPKHSIGTSSEAIRHHYDVGNDFFRLWLDGSLTYSCPLWLEGEADDSLEDAQLRKLDTHIENARASGKGRVLDIGCGWGSLLKRLVGPHSVLHAVGLTLSEEQAAFVTRQALPGVEVLLASWQEHKPRLPYDAIVSIEAIEHFARTGQSRDERIQGYRQFFTHCQQMLVPGGRLSLQSTCYQNLEKLPEFITDRIWPESELPRLTDILEAADRLFEVVSVSNDRDQYARACALWAKRLKNSRVDAIRTSSRETVDDYYRYLKASSLAFQQSALTLHGIVLQSTVRA